MDYDDFKLFFKKHGGKIKQLTTARYGYSRDEFIRPETVDISPPVYLKFVSGRKPRIGAVVRFVDFGPSKAYYSSTPYIKVKWDDREKEYSGSYYEFEFLDDDYSGGTKWVWNTKPKVKEDIPAFTNKYGQELEVGSLIVGSRKSSKQLMFGHITRYTKHNIWINPIYFPCDGKEKNEVMLDDPKQVCVFQEDFLEHLLAIKLMS